MKDDRAWPSSSRPARREDERLGLNVRFNQVPYALANNVTDMILGDDLEGRRACAFDFERSEQVAPCLNELAPPPAPSVQRRDGAAATVDEEWPERTRRRARFSRRLEHFVQPRHVAAGRTGLGR
jgi:hypothetical protein